MTDPYSPPPPGLPPPMDPYGQAPIPALPFSGYGSSGYRQRPGIITTIGVMSIIVGCLSALTSLIGGCSLLEVTFIAKVSKMANKPATVYATAAPPAVVSIATTNPSSDETKFSNTETVVETSPIVPYTAPFPSTGPSRMITHNTITPDFNVSVTVSPSTPFSSSTVTSTTGTSTALTPAEVQGAIARAQRMVNGQLNPAQVAALSAALSDPNQTIIAPGTAWSPVRMGNMDGNGGATIVFTGEFVAINAQGQLTKNNVGMPNFQITNANLAWVGLDVLLSMALAIYIFVAGIMALRQSPGSRRLHFIYILFKIPLAIGGALAIAWLIKGFTSGIAPGSSAGAIVWAVMIGMAAIIYPIALLIALNTRGVKDYYRQAHG